MNEETDQQEVEVVDQVEQVEGIDEGTYTIETPFGTSETTIAIDPTTGEPIEGITESEWTELIQLMQSIDNKTVTTTSEGVPLSLTYEQGETIIGALQTLETGALTVMLVVLVVFIFKQVYKLFSGTFFGGL